jgi:hypothetical protein
MKTLEQKHEGLYHKKSRLHWYAVAFVRGDGEPFMVAATTPKRAIIIAKRINPDVIGTAEKVVISHKSNK